MSGFGLSEPQAEGVLAMTLRRLTGLEAGRLRDEQQQLLGTIADLKVTETLHETAGVKWKECWFAACATSHLARLQPGTK